MKLYDLKMLTVTCEILAQKNVIGILEKHRVSGYTTYEVEGSGSKEYGFKNDKNVKIEVMLPNAKIQQVSEEIARTLFPNYGIVLNATDIQVLLPEKFI